MINLSAEHLISQLYKEGPNVSLKEFPTWALEQLRQVIPFDGAIWGTGHISSQNFHTQTSVDVSDEIFCQLIKHLDINPIFDKLTQNKGQAIDMSSVVKDSEFYRSALYLKCFKPFGIERILSSIHLDERSGIFTLLTLYRFNREHCFTEQEQSLQNRLLYHLLSSASHRQFNEITQKTIPYSQENRCALCDEKGIYHSVTQKFLDILDANFTPTPTQRFPLDFRTFEGNFSHKNLQFEVVPCGELYKISVRARNQLDELTDRERQVATLVCQSKTFKEVAKSLELSPSTVSNHVYRIYLKLGINTRSELNALIKHYRE
ncbi:helix-turn-helix transcriptional regulator [Thalassotalea sp. G2M2-11]|uniref:response regulator transcription factor n=1 Tax=Thalassotalea sp. G2M2-11 TaxID=2787627 RepID=UPI0019CFA51C|nr:helix-turn-helix transcriptional regulator [Thalassotalea sp. G2M2-11]